MNFTHHDSPIGRLLLVSDEQGLRQIGFPAGKNTPEPQESWHENDSAFENERAQLDAYFDGKLTQFSLKLAPQGTKFQQTVWNALQKIGYGKTCSYLDIANLIGNPKASRAVGSANGKNPIPIVIPCHRIIGSNGTLTGFAGGLLTKQWLLAHETGAQSLLPFDQSLASE
jgi:methylated-DNA-[protein]-cysteine S-methyltransferase